MRRFSLVVSSVTLFFLASSVNAKPTNKDNSADLETLKTTVETLGKNLATLTNQVDAIVTKTQTTGGEIGKATKKNLDQDKIIQDSQARLQVLEDKVGILTSQLQELRSEGLMNPKNAQSFREYKEYAKGLALFSAADYQKAITELSAFQKNNPKSRYVNYAHFWIGESYYMQADYPMAIKEYQKLLTQDPRSEKAPTALYKQGVSFMQLQSFDDAKAFFAKVIRSYPNNIEAIEASGKIAKITAIQEGKKQEEIELESTQ